MTYQLPRGEFAARQGSWAAGDRYQVYTLFRRLNGETVSGDIQDATGLDAGPFLKQEWAVRYAREFARLNGQMAFVCYHEHGWDTPPWQAEIVWSSRDEVTLIEAGSMLGVSPSTLRVQIRNNVLHASKFGRDWMVEIAEIERYRSEHLGQRGRPAKSE